MLGGYSLFSWSLGEPGTTILATVRGTQALCHGAEQGRGRQNRAWGDGAKAGACSGPWSWGKAQTCSQPASLGSCCEAQHPLTKVGGVQNNGSWDPESTAISAWLRV